MKISLNWIKEYVKTEINGEDLVVMLKSHLAEVESYEDLGEKYKGIIVAEITQKENHPDADKLGVYQIKIGEEKEIQVVAGDKSLEIGDKVAYFTPGSKVPYNAHPDKFDGIIKATKLRGVESNGMLASAKELDISNNHEQVLRLESNAQVGQMFADYLKLNDYIIDVENKALTVRPDTFGIIGMAREISGILKTPFKSPEIYSKTINDIEVEDESLPITVNNKVEALCPRYMAVSMKDIAIKESPLWLQSKLSKIGVRPINNIVDITNYLMILTGQPLHAFDYDKVKKKDMHAKNEVIITVRTADEREKITTLDGKTIELNTNSVVICDTQNPIAIGGIMGGLDTEIDENTKNIIIESANFDLYNIRKSTMALGIFTDAATRFSKGQDPNLCEPVIVEAVKMVKELAEGKVSSHIQDIHQELPTTRLLTFSVSRLNRHTGLSLTKDEMLSILKNIEIIAEKQDDDLVTLRIPSFRQDLKIPEDIHEEVSRLNGYSKIPLSLPQRSIKPVDNNSALTLNKRIRVSLKNVGANELLTYNFVGAKLYEKAEIRLDNAYHLINALSPDLEYMRPSLIPSLLEKATINIQNGYKEFAIYEINKAHNRLDIDTVENLPIEHIMLTMVHTSEGDQYAGSPYYQIKFLIQSLLKDLKIKDIKYEGLSNIEEEKLPNWIKLDVSSFDINRTAVLIIEDTIIGIVGETKSSVKKSFKLPEYTSMAEINLDNLLPYINMDKSYTEYSKYPKIQQDFCFIVSKNIGYESLFETVSKSLTSDELNIKIMPVDIYQQKENPDQKQITLRVILQDKEKTLKEKDIEYWRKKIEKAAESQLGAKLKS